MLRCFCTFKALTTKPYKPSSKFSSERDESLKVKQDLPLLGQSRIFSCITKLYY